MSTTSDIRILVAEILAAAGVTFTARLIGETTRDNNWKCDEWRCTFTLTQGIVSDFAPRAGGVKPATEVFEFFTGTGHRKPNPSPNAKDSANSLRKVSKRTLAWEQHYKRWPDIAQAPHPATVLHSLILDSSAVGQSFESWCDEYGYDSDSRKALDTYQACQKGADKLARIFNHQQRESLAVALQDY